MARLCYTGIGSEKSVASDGSATVVNKEVTSFAKIQKGGSTEKKRNSSKREWVIMPSSDLNKNILGVFSKSGYRGMSYKIFSKFCGTTPTSEVEEEFSQSDSLSEEQNLLFSQLPTKLHENNVS